MDIRINNWNNELSITGIEASFTIDEGLGEINDDALIEELRNRGTFNETLTDEDVIEEVFSRDLSDNILNQMDIDDIQANVESRGGFTLENVSTEDLRGALMERGENFIVIDAETAKAFHTLSKFIDGIYFDVHNDGLVGKRITLQ